MALRRCRGLLHDEQGAVDATHDVFVQALRHARRLDATAPSSLLYRMATDTCLNRARSRRRHPEDLDPDLLSRIAYTPDEGRTVARIAFDRLFDREHASTREMAVLHLLDGRTLEEVAEETGLSVSGVHRRLRTLRTQLVELEGV